MKSRFRKILAASFIPLALAGCASAPAPSPTGKWRPVNHFADKPSAIALRPAYVYYAAPLDRTLKGLLERWASDSHMTLDYRDGTDYTLYSRVTEVHSDDLHAAIAQLGALYAAQQVSVAIEGERIVVRGASAPAGATH